MRQVLGEQILSRIAKIAGIVVLIFSSGAFFLWLLGTPELHHSLCSLLKPSTALCFTLASSALLLLQTASPSERPVTKRAAYFLALFVSTVGVLSMLHQIYGWDVSVDKLIMSNIPGGEARHYPGRMSAVAGFCMFLLGISVLLVDSPSLKRRAHLSFLVLTPVLLISLVAFVGFLYDASPIFRLSFVTLTWPAAINFVILSFCVLALRPSRGPVYYLNSPRPAGILTRRVLPAILLFPVLLGWLVLKGIYSGTLYLELGVALLVVGIVILLCSVLGLNSGSLERIEAERDALFERLEEAIRSRDEFLSVASHELKTPLTSLKLQAQLRKRILSQGNVLFFSPEHLSKMLAGDERQLEAINRLIDDMLDVARIQAGKLSMHPELVDLNEICKEVVERLSNEASSKGYSITLHESPPVLGNWDRFRIEQVVSNLVSNALKYGKQKPIEISLRHSDGVARLCVHDQGEGIAAENQRRIFQRFERAVNGTAVSGLGLGLYIVKQIVEAHHGQIHVESEVGKGSNFVVELPLMPAPDLEVHA
jgi:signal transduction histidine kinase